MNNLTLLAATVAPVTTEAELSLWSMIIKGGWLMIPIFILSIIAVYIFCEKHLQLRKYSRFDDSLIDKIRDCILDGNTREALNLCSEEDTPMARMLLKGITYHRMPNAELRAIIENAGNLEVAEIEKGLPMLATCSAIAPMIGFLGTVIGMVQAFYDMALAGNNIDITLLSRGIYTAMITTVAGLVVGIISYFAYNALGARLNRLAASMEKTAGEFMEIIYYAKDKKENK